MQRNPFIHALSAKFCLLMLGILLLLAACGSSSSPGSQPAPGNTPQPTQPSNGGYSIITLIQQEMHLFLAPYNP
ncbi:MAG TPA: hypothetical protein VKY19_21470 [Ktedonosporobacter sp.]|jgi:ABC-type glycerol-3-phosphate transport system substrate-binding protein|nr:hypothetical protein [Ktedonosporobacter sp.]